MAYPTAHTSTVAVPLPSKQTVQQMMGNSYDPGKDAERPEDVRPIDAPPDKWL